MMRVTSLALLTFVVAAFGMSTQVSADLVQNGGFETGDFTDWTLSGNTTSVNVDSVPFDVHSGGWG